MTWISLGLLGLGVVGVVVAVRWMRETARIHAEVKRLTSEPGFDITARYRVTLPSGEVLEGQMIYLSPVFHGGAGWHLVTDGRMIKWDGSRMKVAIVPERPNGDTSNRGTCR